MIHGVQIEVKDEHNKIGINFSGGTDSAMVMYLTCMDIDQRKLYHKTIVPMTGIEINRPFNADAAEQILPLIKQRWPKVKFADHHMFQYDVPKDVHGPIRSQLKAKAHRDSEMELFNSYQIDVIYAGISQNPPWEHLPQSHRLRKSREKNREANNGYLEKWLKGGAIRDDGMHLFYHRPLYNVNKKKVAELYHKFDLMRDIFPLTNSCIGQAEQTNFFTEPCRKCWWCEEKKWAFGLYDGAVK